MTYKLFKLAPGSYDVFLGGVAIASLVKGFGEHATWTAELLLDLAPQDRPAPFSKLAHEFASFEEAITWLGNPEVKGSASAP